MLTMSIQPSITSRPSSVFKNNSSATSKASFSVRSKPTQVATDAELVPQPQLAAVAVKTVGRPNLVLKFIWMEKNIGLGLEQSIPGHGTIPLSPYFFWPRNDAWEELRATLQSKPWISDKNIIILLNQATDIINLWQHTLS